MIHSHKTKIAQAAVRAIVLVFALAAALISAAQAIAADALQCDPDYDVVFVPFSPISESDRFEVRVQVKTPNDNLPLKVDLYLDKLEDENKVFSHDIILQSGKWGFVRCFPDIRGKLGRHEIIVRFTTADGRAKEVRKAFEVRKAAENVLEGAFISFGTPKNRSVCKNVADARQLTDEQWKEEMDNLAALGFKVIIPQNSIQMVDEKVDGKSSEEERKKNFVAYYPSKHYPKADIVADDPFRAVLERAEKNGQIVFLSNGCSYWAYGHNWPLAKRIEVMEEMYERYGKYKSFYGWYEATEAGLGLPWQIDQFCRAIEKVRRKATELCPAKPLLWSSGIVANEDPRYGCNALAEGKMDIDIIMPFDVVGCTNASPAQLEYNNRYFSALKLALAPTNIHIWGNPESFEFGPDERALVPRFNKGGFDGSLGFVQQIEAMRPFVEKLVTFQATANYTKPGSEIVLGGEDAVEMYSLYDNYRKSPKPFYQNLALGKPYAIAPEANTTGANIETDANSKIFCSDGYIAGGINDDKEKMHGYAALEGSPRATVDFELPSSGTIDRVRIYKCPKFKNDPQDYSPDKIAVYLGDSPGNLRLTAVLREYKYGWAQAEFPPNTKAKHVRLVFTKQRKPKQEGELKMLINEVEIGRIVKEEELPAE